MTGHLEVRKRLEAKIEELIEMLDLLDGDPDLEDNGDMEPSIGSTPYLGEYDLEWDCSDTETETWANPMSLRVHVPDELRQLREQGYHS
ncbi:MAG: hypothetical protein ACK4ZU_02080 [Allorhizobium sp.]